MAPAFVCLPLLHWLGEYIFDFIIHISFLSSYSFVMSIHTTSFVLILLLLFITVATFIPPYRHTARS